MILLDHVISRLGENCGCHFVPGSHDTKGHVCLHCELSADLVAVGAALKTMVRDAYHEGFSEGMREHTSHKGGKTWQESKACAAVGSEVANMKAPLPAWLGPDTPERREKLQRFVEMMDDPEN